MVKFVAGRLAVHVGTHVEFDDLISYGIFGLIDAIDKFDLDKGVKFETYASLRIRGAIIDNIRKMDWVPRTLRQKSREYDQVCGQLEMELGREPTETEVAARLDLGINEVRELMRKSTVLSLISLDDYLETNYEVSFGATVSREDTPEGHLNKQELSKMLSECIEKLSEKERKVVTLYYFEEMTLKEISSIMEVSESRVSQIHSKAISRMQNRLGKYKSVLFS
jgi:RNA polymerase sigma factor for flagellar operon FliA